MMGPKLTALGEPDASLSVIVQSFAQNSCLQGPPGVDTVPEVGQGWQTRSLASWHI